MPAPSRKPSPSKTAQPAGKQEHKILFQKFFKSVGPRTYASQIKEAGNGNHFLVLTEGKRDKDTDEVRKTRLFIYSEDFHQFFRMLHETAQWIKANPVPDEVKEKRERFWAKQSAEDKASPPMERSTVAPAGSVRAPMNGNARPANGNGKVVASTNGKVLPSGNGKILPPPINKARRGR